MARGWTAEGKGGAAPDWGGAEGSSEPTTGTMSAPWLRVPRCQQIGTGGAPKSHECRPLGGQSAVALARGTRATGAAFFPDHVMT